MLDKLGQMHAATSLVNKFIKLTWSWKKLDYLYRRHRVKIKRINDINIQTTDCIKINRFTCLAFEKSYRPSWFGGPRWLTHVELCQTPVYNFDTTKGPLNYTDQRLKTSVNDPLFFLSTKNSSTEDHTGSIQTTLSKSKVY